MGKSVYAEESFLIYLKDLSKLNVCSTGLILGQSTSSRDYVVHLVRTPEQADSEVQLNPATPAQFQSVKDIKENWIANHARHVTKMLPGGMWVLGIFICSPNSIFGESSSESKVKSILSHLKKQLSNEPLLYGNNPSEEKILLHFNTTDFQYICKSYDFNLVTSSFKLVDWKFQKNYTKWCKVFCNFDLSQPSFGCNMSCPVKDQLKVALKKVNLCIEKAMIALNDQIKKSDDILESLIKNEKSVETQTKLPTLRANILLPCFETDSKMIMLNNCDVELHLLGVLASQVYLSQKTTIAEAISAIKQDIIRSLNVRLEMHWDSLVEEEYGSPEAEKLSVHEPPRRVSVTPSTYPIAFSDYLFPGEGISEVVSSFKEMLDITITEANMEKEIEVQGDSIEFYGKPSISFSSNSSDDVMGSPLPKGLILFLFSSVVILIAIAIGVLFQRQHSV